MEEKRREHSKGCACVLCIIIERRYSEESGDSEERSLENFGQETTSLDCGKKKKKKIMWYL